MENTPNNQPNQQEPTVIKPPVNQDWINTSAPDSPYLSISKTAPQEYYQPPSAVAQDAVNATPYNKFATTIFILLILSLFTFPVLFLPLLIFAIISSRKLYGDTANARKSTNVLIRIFTILGWIVLTIFILFVGFVAFVLISLRNGHAHCG